MDVERFPPAYTIIRRQVLRNIKKGREKVGENNDKWSKRREWERRENPSYIKRKIGVEEKSH